MATEVSICSSALLMLGGQPISDFTENSDRARLASNLYPLVRNYVLRRHPWNCCIKRVSLAPDATTPEFDWDYQYTLPADYLRALSVGEHNMETEFRIESAADDGRRVLLCDENPLLLRYVWRNENPGLWDEMLVWGMTVSMKAVMAYPITQSASLEQLVEDALKDVLKQARAVDGQEDSPEQLGDSPLVASRFRPISGVRR